MNSVERLIAKRYLLSKKNVRFIHVIGFISVGGITVGVAALLIALSVFNGFSGIVKSLLIGFDPHLRIEKQGSIDAGEYAKVEHVIRSQPGVKAYSPFVSGKAMLVAKSFNRVVYLRGVDEKRIADVSGLKEKMVLGELAFRDSSSANGIVLGLSLADRLASIPGNDLMIISPYGMQSVLTGTGEPQTLKFRIMGIYESNNRDYDGSYAFLSITDAQKLFNMENRYSGVEMRLDDLSRSDELKDSFRKMLPPEYTVSTWYDLHQTLYRVMTIERWSAYILLSLIIVVASFNMLGSLTMGVIEKKRDIAVLKSLGMPPGRIVRLFMVEGMLIGTIGTALGMVIGFVVLVLQIQYHLFPLDTSVYIISAIPVEIHWADFLTISAASLGLSGIAAYYPARRAAATLPAEALRWE